MSFQYVFSHFSVKILILSFSILIAGCLNPVKEQSAPVPVASDSSKLIESNVSSSSSNPNSTTPTSEYFSKIASGLNHTCAKTSTGRLKCWGSNEFGQLGTGDTNIYSRPVLVIGSGVTDVAAGGDTTCAILSNGLLKCWGKNNFGQTGRKPDANYSSVCGTSSTFCTLLPNTVIVSGITKVAVGDSHVCAASNTTLKCWGNNDRGQLGIGYDIAHSTNPNNPSLYEPTEIPQAIFKAEYTDCSAYNLQAGNAYVCSNYIKRPAYLVNVLQLSAGPKHTCALLNVSYQYLSATTSTLQFRTLPGFSCWGDNSKGQLPFDSLFLTNGGSMPTNLSYPYVIVNTNRDNVTNRILTSIQAGGVIQNSENTSFTCYIALENLKNKAFCFGDNSYLQQASTTASYNGLNYMAPPSISFGNEITSPSNLLLISTMSSHACAIMQSPVALQASCWGNNSNGQLGTTPAGGFSGTPQVLTPSTLRVIQIVGGLKHTCYLDNSYKLKCIGDNSKGQLGGTGAGSGSVDPVEVDPIDR